MVVIGVVVTRCEWVWWGVVVLKVMRGVVVGILDDELNSLILGCIEKCE